MVFLFSLSSFFSLFFLFFFLLKYSVRQRKNERKNKKNSPSSRSMEVRTHSLPISKQISVGLKFVLVMFQGAGCSAWRKNRIDLHTSLHPCKNILAIEQDKFGFSQSCPSSLDAPDLVPQEMPKGGSPVQPTSHRQLQTKDQEPIPKTKSEGLRAKNQ